MALRDHVKRLPIVDQLPEGRGRHVRTGELKDGLPRPALAVWEFTLACDHRCIHCGPRAGRARPNELSAQEALDLVDELADIGVGEVTLIGGEAYLRNDFVEVVRKIRERGMTCTLTTGGLNLTRERAHAMATAGVQGVNVSVDGLEANHDYVRDKPGSFAAAFRAMGHIKEAGMQLSANTQLNGRNMDDLSGLLDLLADAGIVAWQLQPTIPHGHAADHEDLWLQPHRYVELFDVLDAIADQAIRRNVILWPGNNLGYFGPLEYKLRRQQQARGHYRGCDAGQRVLGIESDGAIKSCPSVGGPTNVGGNWRDKSLVELWSTAPQLTYTRVRDRSDLWGFCGTCYYADTCAAGCTAATEPLLGRPGNNPMCHHRALTLAQEGLRERLELVRPAEDVPFGNPMFRLVLEPIDEEERARRGPVSITQPRTDRTIEPRGSGTPLPLPNH